MGRHLLQAVSPGEQLIKRERRALGKPQGNIQVTQSNIEVHRQNTAALRRQAGGKARGQRRLPRSAFAGYHRDHLAHVAFLLPIISLFCLTV